MSIEFRDQLIALAQRSAMAAPKCSNEESARLFLVLPFISFLGFDHLNPHEVYPEHHADFSDKYKNRVDFAIFRESKPVIAIECKSVGATTKDDRGQLRSYFNAAMTVKMGVLTDGMRWEFFADSEEPNMMDERPFLSLNLQKVAEGHIDDSSLEALKSLRKETFDPNNIGAEAKRKHVFNSMLSQIGQIAQSPPETYCRMLLKGAGIDHVSQKVLAEYTPLIRQAFGEFVNQAILSRMGIQLKEQNPPVPEPVVEAPAAEKATSGIVTTDAELAVLQWAKQRLAFLVEDEALFTELASIGYRDYQGKFVVFYKRERKGRMFDYVEGRPERKGARHLFTFPEDVPDIQREAAVDRLEDIDAMLLAVFKARVSGA